MHKSHKEITIGFVGNPNCGKTTLFNAYTGANLKVANWPGVTVEKKEGAMKYHEETFKLVDLPGIYSLTSYSIEEMVTRQFIMSGDVDVIINVADASSLERTLYLTLQLIELGKPAVLALNMMDIVEKRGMEIDLHRLPEMLGIPVIPVSARKKRGLDILMHAASHHKETTESGELIHQHKYFSKTSHRHDHHDEYAMVYSDEIEDKIDLITEVLQGKYPEIQNYRWHAIKLLEWDSNVMEKYPVNMPNVIDRNYEKDIINQKYDFIEEIIEEVVVNKNKKKEATDRIDGILTHKFFGIPIFLGVMALIFFLTFMIGDWVKDYFELALEWFSESLENLLVSANVNEVINSLLIDGIVGGVGGILTFLPNIFILFLALAFLEDSGYMSRVAYVMDSVMGKMGLSGKAFIPMLLGFGCTVPAVMASRTLEDKRDRMKTIFLTPFMSCSAKLPVYILFSQMFFKGYAFIAAYSMYILGITIGLSTALIIRMFERKKNISPLLIELPEYKAPCANTIIIYVWMKVKEYLVKAGTVIFLASIIIWALLNFGPDGMTSGTDMGNSFGSILGKWLVPVFEPIGLGYWQIIVALISGFAAKEVVISSCSVLFGINNISSESGMMGMSVSLAALGFGALNAYALMVFCLLYVPCAAATATIRKEMESWKWMGIVVVFQITIAWVVTFVIYNIGKLF